MKSGWKRRRKRRIGCGRKRSSVSVFHSRRGKETERVDKNRGSGVV